MKVLDKYIIRELSGPFFLTLFGFLLITIGDTLFCLIDLIVNKGIPTPLILKLMILKLPALFVLGFPVSILFSTLLSLSRLTKDSEITAIRVGKISFYRIMVPVIIIGLFVSILAFITNEKIVPWTNHSSENILRRIILSRDIPLIQENIFFKGGENNFFYVRSYDKEKGFLRGILVYELEGIFPKVLTAKYATWEKDTWTLKEGIIHKYDEEGYISYEGRFKELKIHIDFNPIDFFTDQKTPQEMSGFELLKQIKVFEKGGFDTKKLATDFHFKFSIPFSCLIFVLIGAPLSVKFGRTGGMAGIALGIVLTFCYYVLMSISRSFGFNGLLPPYLAAWSENIIFGICGFYLIWKVEH